MAHSARSATTPGFGVGCKKHGRRKVARRHLGLQKHEPIWGKLEVGYPVVRFRNKVEGKTSLPKD